MQPADALLLIGDTDLLDQRKDTAANDVVTLPSSHPPAAEPGNTVMVSFTDVGVVHVETRTLDGSRRVSATIDGSHVLSGLRPGAATLAPGAQEQQGAWR
ncbi:MAG TPA: hypothetical protein VMV17_06750 [Streptosporangiaceae bacterium]|nr:hypothetical protein [Streptosporangiaceae bacterium]